MSTEPHNIPLAILLVLLALAGCGEAIHVLVESQPILITPSATLPKNLVSRSEFFVAAPDGGMTAVVENVSVTLRQDGEGRPVATLTASGVLRANVPANILLFEVVLTPSHPKAIWTARTDAGATLASYPTQLAASEEGRWHWQSSATTDSLISDGLVVRVRLAYEALL